MYIHEGFDAFFRFIKNSKFLGLLLMCFYKNHCLLLNKTRLKYKMNLSFVKDIYVLGEKMARNGRTTAILSVA